MQAKPNKRILTLTLIGILSLACSAVPGLAPTPTPSPTQTPAPTFTPTITLTPTITITPTPFYEVKTGPAVKLLAGGFAFKRINGFNGYVNSGSAFYESKDSKVNVDMYAYYDPSSRYMRATANLFSDYLESRYDDYETSGPIVETVNDMEQAVIDFSGTQDDEHVHGRVAIYQPTESKRVYLIVTAFGDQRWEREGEKVYNALTSSITFFPIELKAGCRVHENAGYGSAVSPIRIGGGLRLGDKRITDYLDALLGPKGELVAYFRVGAEDENGASLEHYKIYYGKTLKDLYFDIYTSTALSLPAGMACSASLPQPTLP
jgi:hypothetical protein